jgi:hypothetical protein
MKSLLQRIWRSWLRTLPVEGMAFAVGLFVYAFLHTFAGFIFFGIYTVILITIIVIVEASNGSYP